MPAHHWYKYLCTRLSPLQQSIPQKLQGLCRSDRKRPDWLTLVPSQSGKSLTWDVTVVCPLADSYVASAAREARSVAEQAAVKKVNKFTALTADFHFEPVAVEMLGPISESTCDFLSRLAKRSLSNLAMSGRRLFYFNVCPFWCNGSIVCCSTTPSLATTVPNNVHSYHFAIIFFQIPRDP